ncbi:MAG: peptidoglycan-binding protein [Syntrophomonas sp.]|nr:peptidoglycan-binding protein [Syntrophomonas sp.]
MLSASRLIRITPHLMSGPDVLEVQEKLARLGYNPGSLDGIYGEKSCQALEKFQEMRGLNIDGIVGPDTWQELNLNQRSFIPYKKNKSLSVRPIIHVHVDTRILNFTSNGTITTYPVAVGRPTTPTPVGSWTIVFKSVNPGGPFGARWMRLSIPWGGYGIHGTNNPDSIGKAVSHGCIRLHNQDVIVLYDLVRIGTPVIITGKVRKIRNLRVGFRGEDVKDVQQLLLDLGYYPYAIDGLYGKTTRKAVINFQKDSRLTPDGIAGKKTCKALQIAHDLATDNTDP